MSLGGDRIVEHGRVQRSPPRWSIPATGVFVETLLGRGVEGDVQEAETAVELLAGASDDDGVVARETWLLRLRALLARARGEEVAYRSPGPRRCHDVDDSNSTAA